MWLELGEGLWGVVDEGESSGLATTELGLESENVDLLLGALVELSELSAEVVLGDVGTVWVQDVTVNQNCQPSGLLSLGSISFALSPDCHPFLFCSRIYSSSFGFRSVLSVVVGKSCRISAGSTYMTICLRPKSGLRMNLRVLSVTGCSRSAILTMLDPKTVLRARQMSNCR